MSPDASQAPGNPKPEPGLSGKGKDFVTEEEAFVKGYLEITRGNESEARNAFMFVSDDKNESDGPPPST